MPRVLVSRHHGERLGALILRNICPCVLEDGIFRSGSSDLFFSPTMAQFSP